MNYFGHYKRDETTLNSDILDITHDLDHSLAEITHNSAIYLTHTADRMIYYCYNINCIKILYLSILRTYFKLFMHF